MTRPRERQTVDADQWVVVNEPKYGRFVMTVVVSVGLIGAGLYALIADVGGDGAQKVLAGFMGSVIGYWIPNRQAYKV